MILIADAQVADASGWLQPMVILGVVMQFCWSTILSLMLYKLSKNDTDVATLENRLHETTTKLVDERLRFVSHDIANHANALKLTMDSLKERIETGDGEFATLADRDQKIELSMAAKIDGLKDYIREHTASKTDVAQHQRSVDSKFEHTDEKISQLGQSVAVLAAQARDRESRKS